MYSENSKIVICLDSFSKQIYNIWPAMKNVLFFASEEH